MRREWRHAQAAYWTGIADLYDNLYSDPWSALEDRRIGKHLREQLVPGASVVDLACGTGLGCRMLAGSGKTFTYTGVDSSQAMLDNFVCSHARNALVCTDALSYLQGLPTDSVGLVMCLYGSMSFFEDPLSVIREAVRVLEPRGRGTFSFLNRSSLVNIVRWMGRPPRRYSTRHAPSRFGAVPVRAVGRRALEQTCAELELQRWSIEGLSLLAGWCEIPALWRIDQKLVGVFGGLSHSLDLSIEVV